MYTHTYCNVVSIVYRTQNSEFRTQNSELRIVFNIIHEDCNKLFTLTIIRIVVINGKKNTKNMQISIRKCSNGRFPILSPWIVSGDCTMVIQPLEDNH